MSLLLITTIISVLANTILGSMVLFKNYKSRTNQIFSVFCLFVAFWSIATYLTLVISDKEMMLFWVRMVIALATAQSVVIFLFVLTFPERIFVIKKKLLLFLVIVGIITFILCLTPFIFSDVELSPSGPVQKTIVEPGIIIFILITIGSVCLSIVLSFKKYLNSSSILKIQFKYIFYSLVVMYTGVIFFSFIQPVFFQNSSFVYLSSLFTLPFIFLTSYSIIRYRLMDIRVVIRKSVIYGISLIITLAIYTYLVLVFKNTIEESWNINSTWTAVILVTLVALGFPPLKILVDKIVNKIFKNKKSIDLAVQEVKEKLVHETDFDNLINIIKKEIKEYLNIENIKFFVLDKMSNILIENNGDGGKNISQKNNLIKYFEKYDEVLITEEIPHLLNERSGEYEKESLQQAEKEMKKFSFNLVIPVKTDQNMIALIGMSGESRNYTVQDVNYLNKLREQITFAIANALLYKEAIDRINMSS